MVSFLPYTCRADRVLMDPNAGNLPEIFQSQAGVPDFKYQQDYGDVVRIKGPFGVLQIIISDLERMLFISIQEDRLLLSDPKALQYIFHTSGRCTSRFFNITPDVCTYNYRVWFFEMARKNRDFPHFNGPGSSVGRW